MFFSLILVSFIKVVSADWENYSIKNCSRRLFLLPSKIKLLGLTGKKMSGVCEIINILTVNI